MRIKSLSLLYVLLGLVACGQETNSSASGEQVSASIEQEGKISVGSKIGEINVTPGAGKLVVVDLSSLDTLASLGAEKQVIGIPDASISPEYLKSMLPLSDYQNIGTVKEANFEAISNLNPNAIIIADRVAESSDKFSNIAPTYLFSIDYSNFYDSFKEQNRNLAKIAGKEGLINEKFTQLDQKISALKSKTAGKTALVVLVNNTKVFAYGKGTRFGLIYDVFGFKPIDEDIAPGTHGMNVSNEYLVEKNPDYLFVIDRNAIMSNNTTNIKNIIENDLVKNTNAYKNGHIVYLDSTSWYLTNGGLTAMDKMVQEVDASIQ